MLVETAVSFQGKKRDSNWQSFMVALASSTLAVTLGTFLFATFAWNEAYNFGRQTAGLSALPFGDAVSTSNWGLRYADVNHAWVWALQIVVIAWVILKVFPNGIKGKLSAIGIVLLSTLIFFVLIRPANYMRPWIMPDDGGAIIQFTFTWPAAAIPAIFGLYLGVVYDIGFRRLLWKEEV